MNSHHRERHTANQNPQPAATTPQPSRSRHPAVTLVAVEPRRRTVVTAKHGETPSETPLNQGAAS